MASLYAFLDTTPDIEATWRVISKSELSAAGKLKILTDLFTKHVGQLKLEDQPAALLYVACRELMDLKTFAGVNSKTDNVANQEYDKQVLVLLDLLDVEIAYCDKHIKFAANKSDLVLSNQHNRTRLNRVQLMAVKVFEYADQWSAQGTTLNTRALASLKTITACLARFDAAQETFVQSLQGAPAKRKQRLSTTNKRSSRSKKTS